MLIIIFRHRINIQISFIKYEMFISPRLYILIFIYDDICIKILKYITQLCCLCHDNTHWGLNDNSLLIDIP